MTSTAEMPETAFIPTDLQLARPSRQGAALRDYDSVRRAIGVISEQWRTQPTIEAMADAAHRTPDELHHLFRRWAGLTPKDFMQALTLDHAKRLLRESPGRTLSAQLDAEAVSFGACAGTDDFVEGITAFLEKRAPSWTGA